MQYPTNERLLLTARFILDGDHDLERFFFHLLHATQVDDGDIRTEEEPPKISFAKT
jgi:hypothetical protein